MLLCFTISPNNDIHLRRLFFIQNNNYLLLTNRKD